jgi:hypothetical protein
MCVHPGAMRGGTPGGASVVAFSKGAAPGSISVPTMQSSSAAHRGLLGVRPVQEAVGHAPDASNLSALRGSVRDNGVFGLRRTPPAQRMERSRDCVSRILERINSHHSRLTLCTLVPRAPTSARTPPIQSVLCRCSESNASPRDPANRTLPVSGPSVGPEHPGRSR